MKYKLLGFIIIFSIKAKAQNSSINTDSLQNFSYTIMSGAKDGKAGFGTCFFIKKKQELFLITAKHNLYRCDSTTNTLKSPYDFSYVSLGGITTIKVDFPKFLPKSPCYTFDRDTDLLIISLTPSYIPLVNTVENFLFPPFEKIESLEIFGQGMKAEKEYTAFEAPHHYSMPKNSFTFYSQTPTQDSTYQDSVHYFVETNGKKIGRELKGYSGSPAFLQDSTSKRWRLAGLFVAIIWDLKDETKCGMVLVKPEYILQRLNMEFIKPE